MKCELCGNDAEIRIDVFEIETHYYCKDCIMKRETDSRCGYEVIEKYECDQCGKPIDCIMEPHNGEYSYLYCSRECYLKHRGYKLL